MTAMVLPEDHPMMVAWNKFCATDEFKTALRWSIETKYDDGRPINNEHREQHAKGALWLAFTKGIELTGQTFDERVDGLLTGLCVEFDQHAATDTCRAELNRLLQEEGLRLVRA